MRMTREEFEVLANVRIASPCPVRWSDMRGDEKRRFCGQCQQHVHKLSEMKTSEAVALLRSTKPTCVRVFYRRDGTVMTKDCASAWSVGLSESTRRLGSMVHVGTALGAFTVFTVAVGFMLVTMFGDNVRALFGQSAGGLPGSTVVTRRVSTSHRTR